MSNPTIQHYINGRISEGSSGQTQDVFNPATGKVSGQTALANRDDVCLLYTSPSPRDA